MDCLERIIQVNWRHRVLFTDHLFNSDNPVLRDTIKAGGMGKPYNVLLVLDEVLAGTRPKLVSQICDYFDAHEESLSLVATPLVVQAGERAKNSWSYVSSLHAAIEKYHIDRQSYLIAVGGGALLDVAGLAAATAHRGVRHVRIPTTTLSQCDSGVGVKNGVNGFGKKNFIGTFSPPFAVI